MFSEKDQHKGMRISIWEGAFATVHGTLTTGVFLTGFALFLGANDFQIALMMAIPLFTQIMQIFSVHAVEQIGRRKWIVGIFALTGRTLWAFLALIPFVPLLKSHAILVFLIVFAVISALLSFSSAPWLSWMADLVPSHIRGRFFGMRNMLLGIVIMTTSIVTGRALDHYKMSNQSDIGFLFILMVGVICGFIAFIFLIKQPEPPYQRTSSYNFVKYVLQPFQHSNFRKLLRFYLFFTFALALASSYFPVYLLKTLHWSYSNLAILSIGASIMMLLTQPLWGRIVDKLGHKPVIKTSVIGLLPLPVIYIIATPAHSGIIWLDMVFTGIFWSGFNLVMFNMVIYTLPQQGRPAFLAVQAALTGVTNFIAMVIGGIIAQSLSAVSFNVGEYEFINYHFLFLMTLFLRIVSIPLIHHLVEPEAKSVGVMIRRIFLTINRQLNLGLAFWFLGANNKRTKIHPSKHRTAEASHG